MKQVVAAVLLALCAGSAFAQHQPYSGQEAHDIKALSSEEVSQYLSGAGMGFAKSAELNHYPGPMHALELADRLELTTQQRAEAKALMDAHKAQARAIGIKVVESERVVEQLFRSGPVDPAVLETAVRAAAQLQGAYRLSHLDTHLRMRALLTDAQVARYDTLRGYVGKAGPTDGGHRHAVDSTRGSP